MTLRRPRPLTEPLERAAKALLAHERQIALLDRVRPLNLAAEQARLLAALGSGERFEPAFVYAKPPELSETRRQLQALADALDASDLEQRLLAERAAELDLEAALVESLGQPGFAELACRLFPASDQPQLSRQRATEWLAFEHAHDEQGRLHDSDDRHDPESLWCQIEQRLVREGWPVRIELARGLVSLAAVADGVVRVRAGARLTAARARRIALHEVEGHLRPRQLAQGLGGAFSAGTARAAEDEEGRAVLLEERAGLLDRGRAQELAWRYVAASSLREGASFADCVQLLLERGARPTHAIELSCRVHRGGGLGRESIYLNGYLRVSATLALRPELSVVQQNGRVSLAAAAPLLDDSVVTLGGP